MASFTFRRSVLTKPETWTTTPIGITLKHEGGEESLCSYQNIKAIRLIYYPTRLKMNNYLCEMVYIVPASKMEISSISYVSFAEFEDKGVSYTEFVKDLIRNASEQNPKCELYAGKSLTKFLLENLLVVGMIAFFIYILSFFGFFASSGMIIIRYVVIGFSLIYIVKSFMANFPKKIIQCKIPPKVLPS